MLKRLPPFLRNFYLVTGVTFLLWMIFLDANDLASRFKLSNRLRTLENEKTFYEEKIKEVKADRDELLGNPKLLEKYAREKYLMKKPDEDLFVIVEE